MEEKANWIVVPQLPEFLGEGQQVIVVDPDHVVGLDERRQRVGETRVNPQIPGEFD
jgi:hypothetical protein